MRIIKITLGLLLVLSLLLGVAVYVFIQTFDINRFREQFAKDLGGALEREVILGKLALSANLVDGITLQVNGVTIADDPYFSKGAFFSAEHLQMELDPLAFFQRREIVFKSARIRKPQLALIRNSAGALNLPGPSGEKPSAPAAPKQGGANLPKLLMRSAVIEDGTFVWTDHAVVPAMAVVVSRLNLGVENFSLSDAFDFHIDGAVFSDQSNVRIKGKGQLDMIGTRFAAADVEIGTDFSLLNVAAVKQAFPQLDGTGLGDSLEGRLGILISQIVVGTQGLQSLSLDGEIQGGKATLKNLSVPIEDFKAAFRLNEESLALTDVSARLGTGVVQVRGKIDDYLKAQKYNLVVDVQSIPLENVLPPFHPEITLAGLLNVKANIAGQGFQPEYMMSTLTGETQVDVQEGRLLNVNILRTVLSRISLIPDLYARIIEQLPEKYRGQLERNDTLIEKMESDIILQSGTISVSRLDLITEAFALSGRGSYDTHREMLDLRGTVYVPADMAGRIIDSVEELATLLDEDGRLKIPLRRYEGKLNELTFMPDLEYLGKKIFVGKGKQELRKILDKALDLQSSPPQEGQNGQTPDGQAAPEEEIIGGILDKIFSVEEEKQQ